MATTFEDVLIEKIRANTANIREDLGDMETLTNDVKTMGIKTPVIVYPHPEVEGDYLLQEGHRRRRAAIQAGLSTIPCIIVDAPKRGQREDLEVMLTTGRNHKTLTEAEVNHGIQGLLDLDMDVTTICKKFKMSRSEVKARAKLTAAPEALQQRFESGSLDLLGIQKIQELEEQGAEGVLDTVLSQLGAPYVRHDQNSVARTLERAKTIHASKLETTRLVALGGVEAPSDASYSGAFRRVTEDKHEEEHIALGHQFRRGQYDGETAWFAKQSASKTAPATDAEKAEKQKVRAFNGLLGIAYRARQTFLAEAVRAKDGGAGPDADFEMLFNYARADIMRLGHDFLGEVTGIHYPEGADEYGAGHKLHRDWAEKVEKRLRTFTWRQIARMAALYGEKDTDKQLRFAKSFERTGADSAGAWRNRARWLEKVQRLFGYQLDSTEVEALEWAKVKAGPDRDTDYDVDTVTEACADCRQSVVGGEGWEGRCGECADRAEARTEASGVED
ncbi:ParB/RepB/Spo0J family partition protein [Paeniglutamicibacter sp. R2-26]|uniref:ParB/RepB/Spo0J family partition protein n=1 Tax=Paeniglutamicibacter sp. R2-26 TaxID=3144417 RepID=UPI003EE77EB5